LLKGGNQAIAQECPLSVGASGAFLNMIRLSEEDRGLGRDHPATLTTRNNISHLEQE
jgi:hypothetical protein